MHNSTHVFIRVDRVKKSLESPYEGPFPVAKRYDRYFTVKIKGKNINVSVNRLKLAYLLFIDVDNPDHLQTIRTCTNSARQKLIIRTKIEKQPQDLLEKDVQKTTRSGRPEEVDEFVQLLEKQKEKPFNPKDSLIASIANNVFSLVFGYRLPHESTKMSVIIQALHSFPGFFDQAGLFGIPGLLLFFKITGLSQGLKDMIAFNNLLRSEVNKKKKEMNETNETCFAEDYLKIMKEEESKKETTFQETNLIGNIQSLIIGGTETTVNTLLWLFLAMAIHPDVQQKVKKEVDKIFGKSQNPLWTEHLKLPYTYATILECMRWQAVVPGNLLRWTSEDVKIGGYDVPKNTIIVASLWTIQHDSKYWKNPSNFTPERFIRDNAVISKLDGWVPFSLGKRNCPGAVPAMIELFLYFTTIMQKFTILLPETEPMPDLEGKADLLLAPKPYKLKFVPRC
ncbi:vitamin D 25-hydroxylase [Trichonephila clavipes]|nr:vitamin D 25-hydroxylase [Trichonephila clavipes]